MVSESLLRWVAGVDGPAVGLVAVWIDSLTLRERRRSFGSDTRALACGFNEQEFKIGAK